MMLIYKEKKIDGPNFNMDLDINNSSLENNLFQPACHSPLKQEEAEFWGLNRREGLAHSFIYLINFC